MPLSHDESSCVKEHLSLFLKSKLGKVCIQLEAKNRLQTARIPGKVSLVAKPFAFLKELLMMHTNDL